MSAIKYLLDEHVDPRLKRAWKKNWPDTVVWRGDGAGGGESQVDSN
jgi:predicted nuclease of predicted toxin-antitoxin system